MGGIIQQDHGPLNLSTYKRKWVFIMEVLLKRISELLYLFYFFHCVVIEVVVGRLKKNEKGSLNIFVSKTPPNIGFFIVPEGIALMTWKLLFTLTLLIGLPQCFHLICTLSLESGQL